MIIKPLPDPVPANLSSDFFSEEDEQINARVDALHVQISELNKILSQKKLEAEELQKEGQKDSDELSQLIAKLQAISASFPTG